MFAKIPLPIRLPLIVVLIALNTVVLVSTLLFASLLKWLYSAGRFNQAL